MGSLTIRRARTEDARVCGNICFEAFRAINTKHGFPPDMPAPEFVAGLLSRLFSNPSYYCLVAEMDGEILGSNCMNERSTIFGIGPITIDPGSQNHGAGRALMLAMLERVKQRNAPGVRLVQAAFHSRSLSLYTKLGFDVREPLAVMQGPAIGKVPEGYLVRPATPDDLDRCNQLCRSVHGHDRNGDLEAAIAHGTAVVAERSGRITAYATNIAFYAHAVAESNRDLMAMIAAAHNIEGPGFLLPTRNAELFRWCLANGLRVVEPMNLMTVGFYQEPRGAWLPSIDY
jgi:predicted N-acetyltransferase YhbS